MVTLFDIFVTHSLCSKNKGYGLGIEGGQIVTVGTMSRVTRGENTVCRVYSRGCKPTIGPLFQGMARASSCSGRSSSWPTSDKCYARSSKNKVFILQYFVLLLSGGVTPARRACT